MLANTYPNGNPACATLQTACKAYNTRKPFLCCIDFTCIVDHTDQGTASAATPAAAAAAGALGQTALNLEAATIMKK